jgi:TonB-dependent SusC/RagA subfamily outer membrane receptor
MENQDIFNQFKKAADNAESPDFASMEKVWNRVEEKLDKKVLKKESNLWRKIAVAASLLLVATLGYQFLKNDQPSIKTNEIIVQKDTVQTTEEAVVSSELVNPAIKEESEAILKEQIVVSSQVAVQENIQKEEDDNIQPEADKLYSNPVPNANQGYFKEEIKEAKSENSKDMELFINKDNKVSNKKKQMPLLVFDDEVTNKQSVKEIEMEEIESIIEHKEPLYIINGIQYTEEELFGPNPTSPYAPLNQQEIDSISILQDEKAVSIYGEKGKKGVVIISTKDGKPVEKKANKSILNLIEKNKK